MSIPLVSIIVPIYKVEPYLRRCLDSIVNQTYTKLEIILVDDGSPDGCPQICDEYAAKDKRIIVIHKENGGLSDARNAGLDICKGEYVSFVDSDDWVAEDFVNVLINVIKRENADIAIGNFEKVFNEKLYKNQSPNESNCSIEIFDGKDAFRQLFGKNGVSFVVSWGKLYKKYMFEKKRFPIGLLHEDVYTTYKLLYNSSKVTFLDFPLYFYFQREDSIIGKIKQSSISALRANVERYYFIKESKNQDLKKLCFENLCWDLLFAYGKKNIDFARTGYSNRKDILSDFCQCQQDHWKSDASLIEKIILKFFSLLPSSYIIYRKFSPIKIRKN